MCQDLCLKRDNFKVAACDKLNRISYHYSGVVKVGVAVGTGSFDETSSSAANHAFRDMVRWRYAAA